MSLLRLLTAGKSLVGLKDSGNRYRPVDKRALPTFPSKSNPFRTTAKPELAAADAPAVGAPAQTARAASLKERLTSLLRAKPCGHSNKPPVQGELSLDEVKVIRNDLADADLEVVPSRKSDSEPAAPARSWAKLAERIAGSAK
jgi:hypothetical protein